MQQTKDIAHCTRKGWIVLINFLVIVLLWSFWQLHLLSMNDGGLRASASTTNPSLKTDSIIAASPIMNPITKYNIALGIFSVHRPNAPDYVYAEVMSILDALFVEQTYLNIDKIHIFDGSFNGSQVKYFKYSRNVEVHPMDREAFRMVENHPIHRKASLNYLLALKYLVSHYQQHNASSTLLPIDAYLILEDDVIFDPNAGYLIWNVLHYVKPLELFLIDGYVQNGRPPHHALTHHYTPPSPHHHHPPRYATLADAIPVIRYNDTAKCCSQSFLLSPKVAEGSIPLIDASLNGSATYHPLDLYLTAAWLREPGFHLYLAKECWVQHVGFPSLGLGTFHRGCSRMEF